MADAACLEERYCFMRDGGQVLRSSGRCCWSLSNSGHCWFYLHRPRYTDMALGASQTRSRSAQLDLCYCLDCALFPDGPLPLSCLECWAGQEQCEKIRRDIQYPTCTECHLVLPILRTASPLPGLIGIMALWFTIVLTVIAFFNVSKAAALLLVPYLIWVSFASYLNYSLLILNP